ncbi:MAG TPA: transglutaminaseTgpA domain-containing protein [Motilibacteraceae bacterium]|nr:transglutaminaseTgpA domain-containing protein [Motilibacteraceae bacterium]
MSTLSGSSRLSLAGAVATALAAACLVPVFSDTSWVAPAAVLALVSVGAAAAARAARLPRGIAPLAALAGLAVSVTAVFASADGVLGLLPGPGAVGALVRLGQAGFGDIDSYAAPLSPGPGVRFLTAGGIALVAVLVDVAAAGLRRPALAGLPLVALYAVPAAVAPHGVPALLFALAAAGYLGLLLVESTQRVGRWGKALTRGGALGRESGNPLVALGRRVGFGAVALAVVVPVALPGLADGVLGNGSGSGSGGRGNGARVTVANPILDLSSDLRRPQAQDVITYTTDATDPPYLRLVSLDDFTGGQWQPAPLRVPSKQTVENGIATPPGLSDAVRRETERVSVKVRSLDSNWLPVPFPVRAVDGLAGTWQWDLATFNIFSKRSIRDQDYTADYLTLDPTPEQLRSAAPGSGLSADEYARFTKLPKGTETIAATARQVTGRAQSDYDKAVALQQWLREDGGFTYTTDAPDGTGIENIETFLRTKEGFCVHFASTMAVMARTLGIPARVAVGFTAGRRTSTEGRTSTYTISTDDAHAWPELYFAGTGWVPFEPTPRSGAVEPDYSQPPVTVPTSAATSPTAGPSSSASASDTPSTGRTGPLDGLTDPGAGTPSGGAGVVHDIPWRLVGAVLVVLVLLLAPATARLLVRRRRWRQAVGPEQRAAAAWAEVVDLALDHGVDLEPSRTPRATAAELAGAVRLADAPAAALSRLARAAERAAFARSAGDVGDLAGDVALVRSGVRARADRWARLRAVALPASTLALAHRAGERTADALDAVDRTGSALRRRVARVTSRRPVPRRSAG